MKKEKIKVVLCCFEKIPSDVIKEAKSIIEKKFNAEVKVVKGLFLPPTRVRKVEGVQQLLADSFLAPVAAQAGEGYGIGITVQDIYTPDTNFVFGLASPLLRSAIVSTYRLKAKGSVLFLRRIAKEIVHELGHAIYDLPHCKNPKCVMHFSNSVEDTDKKLNSFCSECLEKIKRAKKEKEELEKVKNFFEEVKRWEKRKYKTK